MARALEAAVSSLLGVQVVGTRPVGGGCISEACRVDLADGRRVFAKSGVGLPAGLLRAEADGLAWLAEAKVEAVRLPQVLGVSEAHQALVLEWITPGSMTPAAAARLGTGLALLHSTGAPAFGSPRDGFIGSLPQRNTPLGEDWPEFWLTRRIEPLARQAADAGRLGPSAVPLVHRLGTRLGDLVGAPEPPARVHGDLWSGNVLVDQQGTPWLVDPAAYGGHREVDLAMLHLFGQPHPAVIDAYEAVTPLAYGWRERLELWQIEPLLVHAVLFGGGYGAQAERALRRFT